MIEPRRHNTFGPLDRHSPTDRGESRRGSGSAANARAETRNGCPVDTRMKPEVAPLFGPSAAAIARETLAADNNRVRDVFQPA